MFEAMPVDLNEGPGRPRKRDGPYPPSYLVGGHIRGNAAKLVEFMAPVRLALPSFIRSRQRFVIDDKRDDLVEQLQN